MRYWKISLIALLVISIFLGVPALAAGEETDWSQVDWTQVDWLEIDYNQVDWENTDIRAMILAIYSNLDEESAGNRLTRFWDWVENHAPAHVVFLITEGTDAASAEMASSVLYKRFKADPYAVIQALALEEESTQERVIGCICYGFYNPNEFSQVLGSIHLPDTATDAERAVFQAILDRAKNNWGVVPSTGDQIWIPAALLLVSTLGLAVMIGGKKRLAR